MRASLVLDKLFGAYYSLSHDSNANGASLIENNKPRAQTLCGVVSNESRRDGSFVYNFFPYGFLFSLNKLLLGINMKLKKSALGLAAVVLTTLMVSVAFACEPPPPPPGHSPGYWKHNVRVYVRGIGSYSEGETAASMESYEAAIASAHQGFTLEWADMIFWDNDYKYMWLTVANWFNEAAGLAPY